VVKDTLSACMVEPPSRRATLAALELNRSIQGGGDQAGAAAAVEDSGDVGDGEGVTADGARLIGVGVGADGDARTGKGGGAAGRATEEGANASGESRSSCQMLTAYGMAWVSPVASEAGAAAMVQPAVVVGVLRAVVSFLGQGQIR